VVPHAAYVDEVRRRYFLRHSVAPSCQPVR